MIDKQKQKALANPNDGRKNKTGDSSKKYNNLNTNTGTKHKTRNI